MKCKGLIPIIETESGLSHVRNLEKVKTGRKYITMGVFSVGISKYFSLDFINWRYLVVGSVVVLW